jgi:hypothetical protein
MSDDGFLGHYQAQHGETTVPPALEQEVRERISGERSREKMPVIYLCHALNFILPSVILVGLVLACLNRAGAAGGWMWFFRRAAGAPAGKLAVRLTDWRGLLCRRAQALSCRHFPLCLSL